MISLGEQMILTVLGTASVVADSFNPIAELSLLVIVVLILQQQILLIAELLVLNYFEYNSF